MALIYSLMKALDQKQKVLGFRSLVCGVIMFIRLIVQLVLGLIVVSLLVESLCSFVRIKKGLPCVFS